MKLWTLVIHKTQHTTITWVNKSIYKQDKIDSRGSWWYIEVIRNKKYWSVQEAEHYLHYYL